MNRYEILNAGHIIDGYFFGIQPENEQDTFNRAKNEAVLNLRKRLSNVEALTLAQFKAAGFQCK